MGLASIAEARRAYETGDLRAKLAKYHAHVDVAFRGWNDAWLDPGFKAWNIEDAVGRWRVPALVIQGADDQYGTVKQVRAIEARSPAPVQTLILEACRHAPQFDQPEATLDAIVRFCAEVVQGRGALTRVRLGGQINPSKSKLKQAKKLAFPWISLAEFGTFQWVTANPNKKFLSFSIPLLAEPRAEPDSIPVHSE